MDIFKYIISIRGSIYKRTQEPFIQYITIYTKDGIVVDVGITAKKERMKKARLVGLCDERKVVHITSRSSAAPNGPEISNPNNINIQNGEYMLMYDMAKKEIRVFKTK